MSTLQSSAIEFGYYQDYDSWLYVTTEGELYYVTGPDAPETVWQPIGLPMGDDAEPRTPDAQELAAFERMRIACGIPQ